MTTHRLAARRGPLTVGLTSGASTPDNLVEAGRSGRWIASPIRPIPDPAARGKRRAGLVVRPIGTP